MRHSQRSYVPNFSLSGMSVPAYPGIKSGPQSPLILRKKISPTRAAKKSVKDNQFILLSKDEKKLYFKSYVSLFCQIICLINYFAVCSSTFFSMLPNMNR